MGRGALLHENDARRQERTSRRELTRKFTPGTLGVWGSQTFTVVGWSPIAAVKAQPSSREHPRGVEAKAASWEVAVLINQRLETWGWTFLKNCQTLEEVATNAVP